MSDGNAFGAVIEAKAVIVPGTTSGDDAAPDQIEATQDDRDLMDLLIMEAAFR